MGERAVLWLRTNLIGMVLAWPQGWRRVRGWQPIISVRLTRGSYKLSYDVHRAICVWLLPVLFVLAFTSVYLNLSQVVRPAVNAITPLSVAEAKAGRRNFERPVAGPDDTVALALAVLPSGRRNSVFRDVANGRYSLRVQLAEDVAPYGDNTVYVGFKTGQVTGSRLAATQRAGDRCITWLFPLHAGVAFGLPGRLLVATTGVAMLGLNVTGFCAWYRKWRERVRTRARKRLGQLAARDPDQMLSHRVCKSWIQGANDDETASQAGDVHSPVLNRPSTTSAARAWTS